ncbi:MAG TPA: short-chain dehydrogenase, partial [Sphingomicrobium sp.]|nr:short-chain dehydrogenase [Sphingomicrobium sp.]
MTDQRTAIVTGAGKRVGAELAKALVDRGWTVLAHVRKEGDTVPDGAVPVAADLSDPNCGKRI